MKSVCYEICSKCDLSCDYCISSDNCRIEEYPYERIISFIKKLSPQRVVLSGGEPFLDKNLLPKLKLLRQELPDSFISLSSNGTVNYDFSLLEHYVDCIDISLPTLDRKIYTEMRGRDMVLQVMKNIEQVIMGNFYKRISCMMTRVNIDTVPDLLTYLTQINVDEVRLGRFFPFRDASKLNEKYSLTDLELEQFFRDNPLDKYPFKIVPPIKSLSLMENGYLTLNYGGQVFYPTRDGKNVIGMVDSVEANNYLIANNTQEQIFVGMSTKQNVKK